MLKQDYKFESRALYPELKGKRVVITGGASGIGKATAWVDGVRAVNAELTFAIVDRESAQ